MQRETKREHAEREEHSMPSDSQIQICGRELKRKDEPGI